MDVFCTRKPIFDKSESVVGYELLFGSSGTSFFVNENNIILSEVPRLCSSVGFNILTNNKKAYINFNEESLLKRIPFSFSNDNIVICINNKINPSNEVLQILKELRDNSYTILFTDFIFEDKFTCFIEFCNILKICFSYKRLKELDGVLTKMKAFGVKLFIDELSTKDAFKESCFLGASFFSGHFFEKPSNIKNREIPQRKLLYYQFLKAINSEDFSVDIANEIISKELSLSYKLLKYINSSVFGLKGSVNSIKQATSLLGKNELKKWLNLILTKEIADNKSDELLTQSVLKAKFGENLSSLVGMKDKCDDIFLMELISSVNVFIECPIEDLLSELIVTDDIKNALVYNTGDFYVIHKLIEAYVNGDWNEVHILSKAFNLDNSKLGVFYLQALSWTTSFIQV